MAGKRQKSTAKTRERSNGFERKQTSHQKELEALRKKNQRKRDMILKPGQLIASNRKSRKKA